MKDLIGHGAGWMSEPQRWPKASAQDDFSDRPVESE
jgi:hypothetical protein